MSPSVLEVPAVNSSVSASVRTNVSVTTGERLESNNEIKLGDDDGNEDCSTFRETANDAVP